MTGPLAIIERHGRGPVVVSIGKFKGSEFLDIREHYGQPGELKPTPRGTTIPLKHVQTLYDALGTMLREAQAEGAEPGSH